MVGSGRRSMDAAWVAPVGRGIGGLVGRDERDQLDLFGAGIPDDQEEPEIDRPSAGQVVAKKKAPRSPRRRLAPASREVVEAAPAPATTSLLEAPAPSEEMGGPPGTERPPAAGAAPAGPRSPARGAWLRQQIQARLAGGPSAPAPPPRAAEPEVLSVGELARRIRGTLEQRFTTVHVRGEISNLRQPGSGHFYFTLKDDDACLRAVLFRGQARLLRFRPENGQEVVARGRVGFYEAAGDAQIVCDSLEPVGAGALALAFEQLKARLAAEGLFDAARKRRLPLLPSRIGVVTSPTGAAIRDFLRVLHRRFAGISVLVAPARVQGEGAAEEIATGIRRLAARGDCDLIVVTRGGGSIEDLWAFNEEVVARAIAASPIPVVSAVGHEVDFTIADFVADVRAPTPTGAAEILAPVETELREALIIARNRLAHATRRAIVQRHATVARLQGTLVDPRRAIATGRLAVDERLQRLAAHARRTLTSRRTVLRDRVERMRQAHPALRVRNRRTALREWRERMRNAHGRTLDGKAIRLRALREAMHRQSPHQRILREATRLGEVLGRLEARQERLLASERARVRELTSRLAALSPLRVLARGYALAFRASGAVLLDAADARPGERLHLELAQGALEVEVVGPTAPRKGSLPGRDDEGQNGSIDPADAGS